MNSLGPYSTTCICLKTKSAHPAYYWGQSPARSGPCRSLWSPPSRQPSLAARDKCIVGTQRNTVSSIYKVLLLVRSTLYILLGSLLRNPTGHAAACALLQPLIGALYHGCCQEPVTFSRCYILPPDCLAGNFIPHFGPLIGAEKKKSKPKSTPHPSFLHLGMPSPLHLLTGGGPRPHAMSVRLQITGAIARIGRFPVISHLRRPHIRWNGGRSFVMFRAVPYHVQVHSNGLH